MTLIACPICRNSDLKREFNLSAYRIGRCPSCGVLFNETYYENGAFRTKLFEESYYHAVQARAFENRLENYQEDPSLPVFQKYLEWVEKKTRPGRVLDVGCAFGTFLKVAQGRGWAPHGVEISEYASSLARKTWNFPVFSGDLGDCPFERGFFNLVTFWDVIEHVERPGENLRAAHAFLAPGGFLLITTDNARGLIPLIAGGLYRLSFGRWTYPTRKFFIPHNTCFFDRESLGRLLESAGFKPVHWEGIDYPLGKMNLSAAERMAVAALYKLGDLARLNSQFLVIAQKS